MKKKPSGAGYLVFLELAVLAVLLVLVLAKGIGSKNGIKTPATEKENKKEESGNQHTTEENDVSAEVEAKLEEMSVEELAAQVFLITPEMLTGMNQVTAAGKTTQDAINAYPVGGFVYNNSNFKSQDQMQKMLSNVQTYSTERIGVPMLLAVAEGSGAENSPIAENNQIEVIPVLQDQAENYQELTVEADCVMHIDFLSEEKNEYLRQKIGDEGILITSSMSEPEITGAHAPGEVAVAAINAGNDMIYLPADFQAAYQAVVDAINSGEIPMERIQEAVGRILTKKMSSI